MFNINELTEEISLNRGDTCTISLNINAGTELYPIEFNLSNKDCLYMAIEEPNQPFENAIVKKVINNSNSIKDKEGNILINIASDDTVCLMPGLYYYEIKAKIYKSNQYKNGYLTITFNDDYTYSIVDEKLNECLSFGNYSLQNNIYYLTDSSTQQNFIGMFENNFLKLESITNTDFTNLYYIQCEDEVNTIIPQRRFIIER